MHNPALVEAFAARCEYLGITVVELIGSDKPLVVIRGPTGRFAAIMAHQLADGDLARKRIETALGKPLLRAV